MGALIERVIDDSRSDRILWYKQGGKWIGRHERYALLEQQPTVRGHRVLYLSVQGGGIRLIFDNNAWT